MKIGILCSSDWATYGMGLYKALKAIDQEVIGYALTRHIFGYEEQLPVITVPNIKETFKDCDVVIMPHSDWELLEYLDNKVIIPAHTGTKYRQSPEAINDKFKSSPFQIIDSSEFQSLCPNPKYIIKPMEITRPIKPIGSRLIVGHFPSNPGVKGTDDINRIIWQLKDSYDFEYITSNERVSHEENLDRINQCDIYVELLAPTQGGRTYGSFGVTAIEAACLGKIVITQSIEDNGLYNDTYGPCMLNFVKDEMGLKKTLSELLQYKGSHLAGQQESTRIWAKNHSYENTGKMLMKLMEVI